MAFYYIEKDGKVFLTERNGQLCFPAAKKEIPFGFKVLAKMKIALADSKHEVRFCAPVLESFPNHWHLKDDILLMDNVDKVVKKAINASLVRHTVHAVIPDNGKILMVKGNRGLSNGFWNLPGGFISYGETPEQAVMREVLEETGIKVAVDRLLGIYTHTFEAGYYMISFVYVCAPQSGKISVDKNEIEQASHLSIADGIKLTKSPFVRKALADFQNGKG